MKSKKKVSSILNHKNLYSVADSYINRELSWIAFNQRVLDEANNTKHPILENLKFLSISGSNLDEFYMVRVAGLHAQVDEGVNIKSSDGMLPQEQLSAVNQKANLLMKNQQTTWKKLKEKMSDNNILILSKISLSTQEKEQCAEYFEANVLPVLTPLAIDPAHPFPFVGNLGLVLSVQLKHKKNNKKRNALLPLPTILPRFIEIESNKDTLKMIPLEEMLMLFSNKIFDGYDFLGGGLFRVIRDSDVEFQEEAEDLVISFQKQLRTRRRGKVVRLKIDKNCPKIIKNMIIDSLEVNPEDIVEIDGIIGISSLIEIYNAGPKRLCFKKFEARFPERIRDAGDNIFKAIKNKDLVVHHPYESFDVVVDFLKQAARDPNVVAIKQTLYRTKTDRSPIIESLIEAAEAGKSVTAVVELKARFQEEANIKLSQDLEKAGVHVVYGVVDLKTHAKVSLVVRREGKKLNTYVHFGTGNYHPTTAKIYTDLSLFTCNIDYALDASRFFNMVTGHNDTENWSLIEAAPKGLRKKLLRLIDEEIINAKSGKPSGIWLKCNAIVDPTIINALYKASASGVKIDLIVRGVCCLKPGVPNLSENIRVKSIIGRFLEHGRIYCFAAGRKMPSSKNKVFISSADLMQRNFDRRVELLIPITNHTVHAQILKQIMVVSLNDINQSWEMDNQGHYNRLKHDQTKISAQDYFIQNPSLSGTGQDLNKNKPEEIMLFDN
jgi:polyphosphate kinase